MNEDEKKRYDEAIALMEEDRYVEAAAILEEFAEEDNVSALFRMGECCKWGKGDGLYFHRALRCYRRGAELKDNVCRCALGILYYAGTGVEQSYEKAVEYFMEAAEETEGLFYSQEKKDDYLAPQLLGDCYQYGHGVKQDYAKAAELYRRAAKAGNEDAQKKLDSLLKKHGSSIPSSPASSQTSSSSTGYSGNVKANDNQYGSKNQSTYEKPQKKKSKALRNFIIFLIIVAALYFSVPFIMERFPNVANVVRPVTENIRSAIGSLFNRKVTATVTNEVLNLRSEPSTSGEIVKVLRRGDILTVTGEERNGWTPVEHDGASGWVFSEYINLNN